MCCFLTKPTAGTLCGSPMRTPPRHQMCCFLMQPTADTNILFAQETNSGHIMSADGSPREKQSGRQMRSFLEEPTAGTMRRVVALGKTQPGREM